MKHDKDYAIKITNWSREFLKMHKIYRYRMKKISEMNYSEIIRACHWWCAENDKTSEWLLYIDEKEESL